jgi:hypothetical protein
LILPSPAQSVSSFQRLKDGRRKRQEEAGMPQAGLEYPQAHRWRAARILPLLVLAGLALAQAGCLVVAAGAAAGAAATGYVYYKGKLYRDYPTSVDNAVLATRQALLELQFPLITEENKNGSGYLASKTADGSNVRIWLEMVPSRIPSEGTLTRISARVGAFGDEAVGARILDQVGAHLLPQSLARPALAPPRPAVLSAIQPAQALLPGETSPPPLAAPAKAP